MKMMTPVDEHRLLSSFFAQFPHSSFLHLNFNQFQVEYSKKTKRMTYIYFMGNLCFSLRNSDGYYISTSEGAKLLSSAKLKDQTVVISREAIPFVKEKKSLYNRHVLKTSSGITPNSEVFLVDKDDKVIGTGISKQPGYAMLELKRGVAVRTKTVIH